MPSYKKTIVCLANSTKHHPCRCIAGREWQDGRIGGWIRPVTLDVPSEGAIPTRSSLLNTQLQIAPLDIVTISFNASAAHGCQTENHVIDGTQWVKVGALPPNDLAALVQDYPALWNLDSHTKLGVNDKISPVVAANLTDSLRLIAPENFTMKVTMDGVPGNEKRGFRGEFTYKGNLYRLKITDPVYMQESLDYDVDEEYVVEGQPLLCVSIGEIFNGNYYKLIATILTI
jgi:hypothetical protein